MGIWFGLYWVLSSFFDHYIISGEVIGFRLFRATGLAFAIRIFKVQFSVLFIGHYLLGTLYSKFSVLWAHLLRALLGIIYYWVLFSFFDHHTQSSVCYRGVIHYSSAHCPGPLHLSLFVSSLSWAFAPFVCGVCRKGIRNSPPNPILILSLLKKVRATPESLCMT